MTDALVCAAAVTLFCFTVNLLVRLYVVPPPPGRGWVLRRGWREF